LRSRWPAKGRTSFSIDEADFAATVREALSAGVAVVARGCDPAVPAAVTAAVDALLAA
jgi:hypothetical protein